MMLMFFFLHLFQVRKIIAPLNKGTKGFLGIASDLGGNNTYKCTRRSPPFNSVPEGYIGYLSSFCCASSSFSVSQMSSAFPCQCVFPLEAVLLNKKSRWLAPPKRISLGKCPTASLYQGLHFPLPSLSTLPDVHHHREWMECWDCLHSGLAGCPELACSSPSCICCLALQRWTHWAVLLEQHQSCCWQMLYCHLCYQPRRKWHHYSGLAGGLPFPHPAHLHQLPLSLPKGLLS